MAGRHVASVTSFVSWQTAARALLAKSVAPEQVSWREGKPAPGTATGDSARGAPVKVPRRFLQMAERVAGHSSPDRWRLLYTVLWRLAREGRDLLSTEGDPDIARLLLMDEQVRGTMGARRPGAPGLAIAPGEAAPTPRAQAPEGDEPDSAEPFVPRGATLAELAAAAARCRGCVLYRIATQTVFGRGAGDARVVMVGEQPGDREDREGAPFVGPAGEVLDRALAEAGLARERVYVTNAVKHFRFAPRGRRRIHQTPRLSDITACRPWLEAELEAIRPEIVVCLGATAARALLGSGFRLMQERGRWITSRWAPRTLATLHPSAVLRGDDEAASARLYAMLLADLKTVAAAA